MLAIPLIVSVVLVGCLWGMGDVEVRTKGILSLVWAVCCAGWFLEELGMLFAVALAVLDFILWWLCFGPAQPGRRL